MQIETWQLDRIKPYHRNARKAKKDVDADKRMGDTLAKFGWQQPMVVDSKGVLIIGHRRRRGALLNGWTEGPVLVAHNLKPDQVRALRIADNRLHEDTQFDNEMLGLELGKLDSAGFDLTLTGFNLKELESLMVVHEADMRLGTPGPEKTAEPEEDEPGDSDADTPTPAAVSDDTGETIATPHGAVNRYPYAIYRPSLNKKRTARFLSVRRWRDELKVKGLEAFRAVKAGCNAEDVDAIAGEFKDLLEVLIGGLHHWHVSAPPSSKKRVHFASEVAKRFAELTGAKYVQVFDDRPRKSSSHPAHYASRGDMQLKADVAEVERLLILDDISTSGTTIEQAVNAVRERSPGANIISCVWIYENA